jgi:environmental stress-induced protein Ves
MTQHRLLTPADYRRMPWKNGGGRTTEIAASPPGAALDAFDWRVSVADVAKPGPFSRFPGVDRIIVMIAGNGMRLDGDGHAAVLRASGEPYAFGGEDAIECTLLDGPVRDFNLMVRRDRARGDVAIVRGESLRVPPASFRLCYAVAGAHECLLAGHPPIDVATDHALLLQDVTATPPALSVNPVTPDAVALVVTVEVR